MKLGFPSSPDIHYDWISLLNSYKQYVKPTSTVLEIGASTIERTKTLVNYCKKIIAVELFPNRIPKNFSKVEYVLGDWQKLTKFIPISSIDLVISNQVIEHVENDSLALDELYRIMKPNGIALISTPNRTRLIQYIVDKLKGKERVFPWGEHIREYTEDDLIKLIKKSRFKKYKIKPTVFGLHAGPLYFYSEAVPSVLKKYATFLELYLYK